MNADTKVHLAHVQAFFYKLESLSGENIILLYHFGKKKKNNFLVSKQIQSAHRVLFLGCIELWTKAVLSSDPAFFRNIVVLRDRDKSKVESGKPAKTRASQGTNPIGIGEKG